MSPASLVRLDYLAVCLTVGFEPTYRPIPVYDGESLRVSAVPRCHLVLCTESHLPSGRTCDNLPERCSTKLSYVNVCGVATGCAVTVGVSPVLFARATVG